MKLSKLDLSQAFLFRGSGFSGDGKIYWNLIDDEKVLILQPNFNEKVTFEIDNSEIFCVGWHDLKTGENHKCAKNKIGEIECYNCRELTAFNPAFYNSDKISPAQIERNSEPHVTYLVDFGGNFIKVGIAHFSRKLGRLLDQGARSAVILDQFSSANVARKYESEIAKIPNFVEAVRVKTKLNLLSNNFNLQKSSAKLLNARNELSQKFNADFKNEIQALDKFYLDFNKNVSKENSKSEEEIPTDFAILSENFTKISGKFIAQVGSIGIFENDERFFAFDLKKLRGKKIRVSLEISKMELPAQQIRLF